MSMQLILFFLGISWHHIYIYKNACFLEATSQQNSSPRQINFNFASFSKQKFKME